MLFKLLRGLHHQNKRTYSVGDLIESTVDLAGRLGKDKFERVLEAAEVAAVKAAANEAASVPTEAVVDDGLSGKSVAELRAIAEAEEIDLGNAVKRNDILTVIRAARKD
jgi:hypothetical protein